MTENKQYTIRCDEFNAYSILKNNKDVIVFDLPKSDAELICNKLNELHEENFELHIQNDFLKDENQYMRDVVNENEQLKCGNKNLKAVLNDFINILNRLQANPNDKLTLNVARDMLQNMGKELE